MDIPLVQMKNICKHFGGLKALQDITLDIGHSEVLGLVGDNGAGKSTLIKTLVGVNIPDAGEIYFDGNKVSINNPRKAKSLGIGVIYQELALIDCLDPVLNTFLGQQIYKPGWRGRFFNVLDKKKMKNETVKLLGRLGIKLDSLKTPIINLSGGQRQAIAIARSLYTDLKLLIMDEPTAAIAVDERRKIFELVHQLKENGVSVIFISHNLEEIFTVANRVIVLSRGKLVANRNINDITHEEIVKFIISK